MGDEGALYSHEVLAEGALVGVGAAIGATDGAVVAGADHVKGFPSRHVGGTVGLGNRTHYVSRQREGYSCPNYVFAALGGYCEESLWLLHGGKRIY